METIFLNAAGTVQFVRDDMESGTWTQEEYTVNATFPYDSNKVIQHGQRIAFREPATNNLEMFEIRNVQNTEPDHAQLITAEHIVVAELSDEHIDKDDFYNVPPQTPLASVLTGTLWAVGNVSVGDPTEQATIKAQITALGLNGNVDLTSRPLIYPEKMHNAGYTDFDGDYATLYSMTYTTTIGTSTAVTLLFTPIKQDGTVFSQAAIDEYVDSLCAKSTTLAQIKANDTNGLYMHGLSGTKISQMDAIAVSAHDLSDAWEQCIAGEGSSANISRGSVWQAVNTIQENWNVYITPRVTVNSAGSITGRYLDIKPAAGTWRGVRLSVDKNLTDSTVIYDDSEVYTALYGYGGSVDVVDTSGGDDTKEDLTFADIVWTATDEHPAKPSGQTYIEDPSKTALYGRNGRPRFGYYQNSDIDDGEVLLEKTWASLKECFTPRINISGTVTDLYRLGYKDEPLRLHDLVIVDITPTGETFQKEIIKLTVDLIDPTATQPEIGDYIKNIIYINSETSDEASGGGGGGGGGSPGSKTELEDEKIKTFTSFEKTDELIGMIVGTKEGTNYIKAAEIALSINSSTGETEAKIDADHIYLDGETSIASMFTMSGNVYTFTAQDIKVSTLEVENSSFKVGNQAAEWKSMTVVTDVGVTMPTITRSSQRYLLYSSASGNTTPSGTQQGRVITAYTAGTVSPTTDTIYYLGRSAT